jgi:hypothetical protein
MFKNKKLTMFLTDTETGNTVNCETNLEEMLETSEKTGTNTLISVVSAMVEQLDNFKKEGEHQ